MPGTSEGVKKAWRKRKAARPLIMSRQQMIRLEQRQEMFAARSNGGYVSGLNISLQKIQEDDNPSFKDIGTRIDAFNRMANDSKVAAQIRAQILPVFSAVRATVEGGTPEMRDLVAANLLRQGEPRFWCDTSWLQRVLEKLMCLHYGFSLHGKTWTIVDGYRIYQSLTYLHPKSLSGTPLGPWEWDGASKRLVAIHRAYKLSDGNQVYDERIPIEDIDATVWWQTGENWEGQSLIRPMYGAWVKKDLASKIAMIALLNGGVGIPMATAGPGDGVKDQQALKTMAGDLRGGSKERQFLVLMNGQKMEFLTTNGQVIDATPVISEQNMDIASAGATDFMQSAQTQSGSRAGGSVMMVSYMQQLDAVVRWLEEQINHGAGYLAGLVEDLIYANWPPEQIKECPRIVLSRVSPTEQLDNVPNILDAVQKGGLIHDLSVENHVRKALGIDLMDQATFDDLKKPVVPMGGRPDSPTPVDQNEPRNDSAGRAFGLTEKKTPDGSRPKRNPVSYPWLKSSPGFKPSEA